MNDKDLIENETEPTGNPPEPETEPLSGQQLMELKEQAAKAAQFYDQLLRTTADLENFKKRAARERQDAIKYANESLLERIIPVLDNFDAALAAAGAQNTSVQSLQSGVNMIQQQLKS